MNIFIVRVFYFYKGENQKKKKRLDFCHFFKIVIVYICFKNYYLFFDMATYNYNLEVPKQTSPLLVLNRSVATDYKSLEKYFSDISKLKE